MFLFWLVEEDPIISTSKWLYRDDMYQNSLQDCVEEGKRMSLPLGGVDDFQ